MGVAVINLQLVELPAVFGDGAELDDRVCVGARVVAIRDDAPLVAEVVVGRVVQVDGVGEVAGARWKLAVDPGCVLWSV